MSLKYKSQLTNTDIRQVRVWVLMIFNPDTGNSRCYTFKSSDECLDNFLLYKDSSLFPDAFSRTIYVGPDHPLYHLGTPVDYVNGSYIIK